MIKSKTGTKEWYKNYGDVFKKENSNIYKQLGEDKELKECSIDGLSEKEWEKLILWKDKLIKEGERRAHEEHNHYCLTACCDVQNEGIVKRAQGYKEGLFRAIESLEGIFANHETYWTKQAIEGGIIIHKLTEKLIDEYGRDEFIEAKGEQNERT